MIDRVIYLDTSAFLKSVLGEAESPALEGLVATASRVVSSELLETEARRAAIRLGSGRLAAVEVRLESLALIAVTRDVLVAAGRLRPAGLRSLDAIHIATALSLGGSLSAIVTYDRRMAMAAVETGLPVSAPGQ